MNRSFSEGSRRLFRDTYQPFSNGLMILSIAFFLGFYLYRPLFEWISAPLPLAWMQPWRLFTAPLVPTGIIGLLFTCLGIYQIGGSLERGWGTKTIAIFYALSCLVTALSFTLAARLFGGWGGVWMPGSLALAAAIVAFCTLNPDETINIYGIIPVKTRYIAAGVCVIIFFSYGWNNPLMGLFALASSGLAVWWVKNDVAYRIERSQVPVTLHLPRAPKAPNLRLVPPGNKPRDDRFSLRDLNPLRWFQKRAERKKFEKLMRDD